MGDSTGLIVIGALAVGAFLFKDQIGAALGGLSGGGGDAAAPAGGDTAGGDTSQQQQQPAQQTMAPTPLGAFPYPVPVGYPVGYAPYGVWPYPFPPVIGHFSAPRWFNNWPRPGPWGFPHPHPGPRFLGPPVPAPFPHH